MNCRKKMIFSIILVGLIAIAARVFSFAVEWHQLELGYDRGVFPTWYMPFALLFFSLVYVPLLQLVTHCAKKANIKPVKYIFRGLYIHGIAALLLGAIFYLF